jgi:hypothetical protein
MSLTTPSKLRELQIKLYRKAKNEASTGAIARHQPLQSKWYSANWGKCSSAESGSNLVRESAVKPVGKPDALIGHVRFDERGWETGRRSGVSTRAHPRLYKLVGSTLTVSMSDSDPKCSSRKYASREKFCASYLSKDRPRNAADIE